MDTLEQRIDTAISWTSEHARHNAPSTIDWDAQAAARIYIDLGHRPAPPVVALWCAKRDLYTDVDAVCKHIDNIMEYADYCATDPPPVTRDPHVMGQYLFDRLGMVDGDTVMWHLGRWGYDTEKCQDAYFVWKQLSGANE